MDVEQSVISKDFKEIQKAIKDYSGGRSEITWMSLFSFSIEERLFCINYGRSGDSKGWNTSDLAKKLNLYNPKQIDSHGGITSPVVIAPNSCTDRSFFDFLKLSTFKLISYSNIFLSSIFNINLFFLSLIRLIFLLVLKLLKREE